MNFEYEDYEDYEENEEESASSSDDIYSNKTVEQLEEDDELSPSEAGFIHGYNRSQEELETQED